MKSYKQIEAVKKNRQILKFIATQKEPVPAPAIAAAVGLPLPTVMCHLVTSEECGDVQQINGYWKLGMGLALIYARKKADLEGDRDRIVRDISELEKGGE